MSILKEHTTLWTVTIEKYEGEIHIFKNIREESADLLMSMCEDLDFKYTYEYEDIYQ